MAHTHGYSEDWHTLPWKSIQRNVFRLQRRIYQAARRNDVARPETGRKSTIYNGCYGALGQHAV